MLPKVRRGEALPVVVFIHGGGWPNGNKERGRGRVEPFVASGNYAGVTVGYRLRKSLNGQLRFMNKAADPS